MCACTVVMLVYLAFAMAGTNGMSGRAAVGDMRISVADSLHTGFITPDDVRRDFVRGYRKGAPAAASACAPSRQASTPPTRSRAPT